MIPKVIHYCWFGGNPLPELALKCIESWKRYLPDYEIKEWNETNFNLDITPYVREAYDAKKYAFVSDYARFLVIYNYGGLYFDTDVEVIKPLDDIIAKGAFMGVETAPSKGVDLAVNAGLGIGAEASMPFYKEILDMYNSIHFNVGTNEKPMTVVEHVTTMLFKHGMINTPHIQSVMNINIYPKDFFCPLDYYSGKLNLTADSKTIHHFASSWVSGKDKLFIWVSRLFGFKFAKFCSSIYKQLI